MKPQVQHFQFPRKTWQVVTEHALRELAFRESQDTTSRIENLRPFHFEEETESNYGRQIWCFESLTALGANGRRVECGALEFSIEYGLIELIQCRWFSNDKQRDLWIAEHLEPPSPQASSCALTRVWIYLAILSVLFLAIGWTVSLLRFLNVSI